jgi:protein-export membrane protein SecD
VAAGRIALIVGFLAVIGFMIISYNLFGLYANIALVANLGLIMAVLSGLQATLTLPGIAGIVLTVGMAVDANVLIFERIREELAAGKAPIMAIDTGYNRALGTILDANITTLLAAMVLFQLGSGPIRGFAITLAIGIVTSVFTAFVLTRFMVSLWVRRQGRPEALPL